MKGEKDHGMHCTSRNRLLVVSKHHLLSFSSSSKGASFMLREKCLDAVPALSIG